MNKLSLRIALSLPLGLAAANVASAQAVDATTTSAEVIKTAAPIQATPVIQKLSTPELTAKQFETLFKKLDSAPAISSDVDFFNSPVAGTLRSQVFQGAEGTAAAGLYAYAYQLTVNDAKNNVGEPVHVDSASWQFNATPAGTDFTGAGEASYAYSIKDGPVGNLLDPAAGGAAIRTPASLSWTPGEKIGTIRADYVDPSSQSGPLASGDKSASFVVISKQPWSDQFQYAGVLSSNPQEGAPAVYSASGGPISPVPVPEPATLLAWAGMAGAALLVRRVRKARTA